ncbi:MAG: hypothetical protein M3N14_04215 [Bacteroidota bacterium]|nr:hypothetical protein [Bacteroidota bacterium]
MGSQIINGNYFVGCDGIKRKKFVSRYVWGVPCGPGYPLIRLQALGAACAEAVNWPVSAPIPNAKLA